MVDRRLFAILLVRNLSWIVLAYILFYIHGPAIFNFFELRYVNITKLLEYKMAAKF